MSDDDEGMSVEWVDELDIDELINDDHEYQFNTRVAIVSHLSTPAY